MFLFTIDKVDDEKLSILFIPVKENNYSAIDLC